MPSVATSHADASKTTSVFSSTCAVERRASLGCIEDNYGDPSSHAKCREFFEKYKECTGAERIARLKRNNPDYKE